MKTAEIIYEQLGSRARYMLGAHTFVGDEQTRSLRFGIKGSRTCNVVVIQLADDDTYTVRFARSRGMTFKIVAEVDSVYVDRLHATIETHTGLYTSI